MLILDGVCQVFEKIKTEIFFFFPLKKSFISDDLIRQFSKPKCHYCLKSYHFSSTQAVGKPWWALPLSWRTRVGEDAAVLPRDKCRPLGKADWTATWKQLEPMASLSLAIAVSLWWHVCVRYKNKASVVKHQGFHSARRPEARPRCGGMPIVLAASTECKGGPRASGVLLQVTWIPTRIHEASLLLPGAEVPKTSARLLLGHRDSCAG